jgi:hypothetical protein
VLDGKRSTTVEGQTVSQSFVWNDLGQTTQVTYPQISGVGSARTVTYGYANDFLPSVPSYAPAITYSVNASCQRGATHQEVAVPRPSQTTVASRTTASKPHPWAA